MPVTVGDSSSRRFDTDAGVRATLVAIASLAARLCRADGAALCLTRDGTLEVVSHTGTLRSVRDVLARCRQIVQGSDDTDRASASDARERAHLVADAAPSAVVRRRDDGGPTVSAVAVVGPHGEILGALGVTGSRSHPLAADPDVLLASVADHVASLVGARATQVDHEAPPEGQVAALLADATVAIVELGPDGVVHHANPAAAALSPDGSPTGRRLEELVVPTDREAVRAAVDDLAAGRTTSRQLTARYLGRGSTHLAGLTTVSLVRAPEGGPRRLVAVVVDQTLREDELADLTAREERAAGLLRAIPDAIVVCAHDGTIVEVNDQVGVLFGYRAEELVGQPIEILVPDAQSAAHSWHRSTFVATPHAAPMITGPGITGRRKDGTLVPVEVNLAAVDLSSGPVVVASVRDVTESRRTAHRLRATHDLMSDILGAATEQAVIAVGLDGTIELFSRGAERLLGWNADEVIGTPVSRFVHPDDAATTAWGLDPRLPLANRVRDLVGSGIAATRPATMQTRAGDRRSVLVSITVRHGESGPSGLIIVATDQTARLRQEKELESSEARFRLAFDNAPVGVALVSARPGSLGRYLQVNAALVELLGYPERELLGATVQSITHLEDLPEVVSTLGLLADGTVGSSRLEHRYSHVSGRDVWANVSLSLVRDAGGMADYFVAQVADVTERKRAEAELTHNALHDTLTGLPNRMLLMESLARAQARAERTGTGVGVLYIDLDNFKDVNDSLGHAAGDELLVAIALRLTSCMRDSDTAGRLGGDEFVVICEDLARLDEVTAVADRVTRALAVQLPVAGRLVTISASIGIAHSTNPTDRPEDLLRIADIAMYRAKGNGRARYEHPDPELQVRAIRQLELESDLREALEHQSAPLATSWTGAPLLLGASTRPPGTRDQLRLAYQPCFDSRSHRMVAVEALLRWDHPTRGPLSPGEFLDVAEDRALMVPLGLWVLQTACAQASAWVARYGPRAPEVWVNVSTRQLGRNGFAASVADALEDTGLPADRLCLELTERQALSTAHSALHDLDALPELGVRLAIDDFGTGYAGLDYLRRLPVSALKVDASYVAEIGTGTTGAALIASVINLGRALDLTVVAEGVETAEQRDGVTDLGADVLQGFLLARPGPPSAVDTLLASRLVEDDLADLEGGEGRIRHAAGPDA